MHEAQISLSVLVPVHNEESVVAESLRRVGNVLDAIPGGPHEIVFVDDGSSDRTLELLEEAAALDPRIMDMQKATSHQASQ
jgi:dolichol-phosphate mannosyltransferase